MLARLHQPTRDGDEGFTLIELLVVMIIIGILAGIAIPVFLNQRSKANDVSVKADVTAASHEIATYYVDNNSTLYGCVLNAGTLTISTASGCGSAVIATTKLSPGTTCAGAGTGGCSGVNVISYQSGTNCDNTNSWYLTLDNPNGATKTWYYSAQSGLSATQPAANNVTCH